MTSPIALGAILDLDVEQATRWRDDLALAAQIGLTAIRVDVPWARTQPRAGALDGDVVETVLDVALAARDLGLAPWLRLLQPQIPAWFDDEGGFTDARNAGRWWPRWVDACADVFGDQAAGWVPFETPFAMARRIVPDDPRRHGGLVDTLVVAWRDAWRILRGGPPVMTSLDVAVVRPADDTAEAAQAANRIDQLRWGVWLDGLREGTFTVPGRAERELADLAGACDVVGLAIRDDAETVLYRAAEQGPERPLAVTFRPLGDTDAERSRSVQSMWRGTRRAAEELAITSVTITPFVDHPPVGDGIVTAAGELKDSGQSFVAG
ncbi:MAG: family 1 glycosylhydrolase [Ilumatobacteraceae bacterium]